jgi:hypothetical protein
LEKRKGNFIREWMTVAREIDQHMGAEIGIQAREKFLPGELGGMRHLWGGRGERRKKERGERKREEKEVKEESFRIYPGAIEE